MHCLELSGSQQWTVLAATTRHHCQSKASQKLLIAHSLGYLSLTFAIWVVYCTRYIPRPNAKDVWGTERSVTIVIPR